MIRVLDKSKEEYEIQCDNCKSILVFDSPEDLSKEYAQNSTHNPMYCISCPVCGQETWFNGLSDCTLSPEFAEKIKDNPREYLEHASKKFQEKSCGESTEPPCKFEDLLKFLSEDLDD